MIFLPSPSRRTGFSRPDHEVKVSRWNVWSSNNHGLRARNPRLLRQACEASEEISRVKKRFHWPYGVPMVITVNDCQWQDDETSMFWEWSSVILYCLSNEWQLVNLPLFKQKPWLLCTANSNIEPTALGLAQTIKIRDFPRHIKSLGGKWNPQSCEPCSK